MTENANREMLVNYAKAVLSDLVPYDDPRYDERLQELAEGYADSELNPNPEFKAYMDDLCKEHDEILNDDLDL